MEISVYPTRQHWLEGRRRAIGASEVAAILGVPGYLTPMDVYISKILGDVQDETDQMLMGRASEDGIAQVYIRHTGRELVHPGEFTIRSHSGAPLAATLDRIITGPDLQGPLQIKSVGMSQSRSWDGEPPLAYQIQVQAEMACSGAKQGSLAGWIGNQNLVWFDLERDEEFISGMIQAVESFWRDHIEARVPPPATPGSGPAISRLYPKDDGKTVALDSEALVLADRVGDLASQIGALKSEKDAHEGRLKLALGDASWGLLPDGSKLQWRLETRKEHWVNGSSTRVFRRIRAPKRKGGR